MVPSEQVPTPSLHQLPDPGGPLMRTFFIGARPPVHRCSSFPQLVIALCPLFLQFIWHANRHSRVLQGISARPMICRKNPNLPRTTVSALFHAFLQIIRHGNRHSTGLQGISARAVASICVHRAPRTPPDIALGHINSRGDLQEEPQPATHSCQCPIPRFPANHLARHSPF